VPQRIAAIIGHAEEFALLATCLRHHERLGVEAFYVSADAEAVAAQRPLLDRLARRADVRIHYRHESEVDAFHFLSSALRETVAWCEPNWVLVIDSDEFCACAEGRLQLTPVLRDADIITLPRFNIPLHRGWFRRPFDERMLRGRSVPLVVRPHAVDLTNRAATMWPPWILGPIAPKLLLRPTAIAALGTAGHSAIPVDASQRRAVATSMCVMHLPFTTFARFRRKAERIREKFPYLDARFAANQAHHWKRWAVIAERGELATEFTSQSFDRSTFAALVADGTIATVGSWLNQS
jgi:hypothetical protein